MISEFIQPVLHCNICGTALTALRDEAGWSYKHFQYWPNKCINENKQFFVDGRVEEISTRIHVSEVADYPVFDATLGGALLGRTFTRTEADAMIHIISTSVHGGCGNGTDEPTPNETTDPDPSYGSEAYMDKIRQSQ